VLPPPCVKGSKEVERQRIGAGVNNLRGVGWSDLSIYCLITLTCFSSESPLDNVTHSPTEWGWGVIPQAWV